MLPILRILPVGGVLLAILILVLALKTPDGPTRVLHPPGLARGPLIDRGEHPEWRQFIMQAALRRAEELSKLRELFEAQPFVPLEPAPKAEAGTPVAGLPGKRIDAEPDAEDITGSTATPASTIPVEIGESSSFELPVVIPEERPAIIAPERAKPGRDSGRKPLRKQHRAKAKPAPAPQATQLPPPFNLLEAIFGGTAAGKGPQKSEATVAPQARGPN